ncbi:MAG: protein NnrT [Stappia sp.]|uniref:hypothetical protein n=1 Tax=Stappia sp. TaxID=1870903 RepID=UPI000C4E7027|nr:hypothetical protein [Stappia sp.]MAA98701.1 protein NnrT [Stappia sp.]MBM20469.1 protein NnrT [Stappia sp.]
MRALFRLRTPAALVASLVGGLSPAVAKSFERPIPAPQTDQAEVWFLVASLALVLSLVAVQWLVARR